MSTNSKQEGCRPPAGRQHLGRGAGMNEAPQKERPIIFSGAMVRALLAGTKTQTRRVASKAVRHPDLGNLYTPGALVLEREPQHVIERCCPYGRPGDRLWVREATVRVEDHGYTGPVYVESEDGRACLDGGLAPAPDDCTEVEPYELRIRPSIHMPRWASRITLEITGVRVERLQDISIADAMAEGVEHARPTLAGLPPCLEWRYAYEDLWNDIHGPRAWDANPWVWVVEFKKLDTAPPTCPENRRF
ncbi:MAG: hypothetical protein QM586_11660 [Xenophilus sp.]